MMRVFNQKNPSSPNDLSRFKSQLGFNLIELMVAITIGLIILASLSALFINITSSNSEMAKTNLQIENGRFAMQLLESDLVNAGFWGNFVPQFDDLTLSVNPPVTPADVPTTVYPPNVCLAYSTANWNEAYKTSLIDSPVQVYDAMPAGCNTVVTNKKSSTDVLVVHHAETCAAGIGTCEADTTGKLYFQSSLCESEISATALGGTTNSITLAATASSTSGIYVGASIRITGGTGAGQSQIITAYNGSTKVATVGLAWSPVPDNTSIYQFGYGYVFGTSGFGMHNKNPSGSTSCGTLAEKRKFVSNIYFIQDIGGNPTLVRSQFDLDSGTLKYKTAEALIEGIEGFHVELGIDNISDSGNNVINNVNTALNDLDPLMRYTQPIIWASAANRTSPNNRGDGSPDGAFISCTTATPCTSDQLANTVAVKLYVLARNKDITKGYTDTKVYSLGSVSLGPFNDNYKRHVFSTSVRLINVSTRRETP